jgi:hypothetical protein
MVQIALKQANAQDICAEVMGDVRYNLSNLSTSWGIDLKIGRESIASHNCGMNACS